MAELLSLTRRDGRGSGSVSRHYGYNSYRELCRSEEPETGVTLRGYDGAGNLAWSAAGLAAGSGCEDSGSSPAVTARRIDRSYDARNRLTSLVFPDGQGNQSWTYTADGRPQTVSVANPGLAVQTTYSYNRRRLLTQEQLDLGGTVYTAGYGYDALGHLSSQSYPSGLSVAYAPNALGQPTQVGSDASAVRYAANGAIQQFVYGNGVVHALSQNARQLPARSTDCAAAGCAGADQRLDLSYSYDANGNVSQIADGVDGRPTSG